MLSDLKSRLGRKPFNYRLESTIKADIKTIEETLQKHKAALD